jgi:hypothetical protein
MEKKEKIDQFKKKERGLSPYPEDYSSDLPPLSLLTPSLARTSPKLPPY